MTTESMMDSIQHESPESTSARIARELDIALNGGSTGGMNTGPKRRIRKYRRDWLPEDPSSPRPNFDETLVSSRTSIFEITD